MMLSSLSATSNAMGDGDMTFHENDQPFLPFKDHRLFLRERPSSFFEIYQDNTAMEPTGPRAAPYILKEYGPYAESLFRDESASCTAFAHHVFATGQVSQHIVKGQPVPTIALRNLDFEQDGLNPITSAECLGRIMAPSLFPGSERELGLSLSQLSVKQYCNDSPACRERVLTFLRHSFKYAFTSPQTTFAHDLLNWFPITDEKVYFTLMLTVARGINDYAVFSDLTNRARETMSAEKTEEVLRSLLAWSVRLEKPMLYQFTLNQLPDQYNFLEYGLNALLKTETCSPEFFRDMVLYGLSLAEPNFIQSIHTLLSNKVVFGTPEVIQKEIKSILLYMLHAENPRVDFLQQLLIIMSGMRVNFDRIEKMRLLKEASKPNRIELVRMLLQYFDPTKVGNGIEVTDLVFTNEFSPESKQFFKEYYNI